MLTLSDLKRIRTIEIKAKKLVKTLFAGLYASTFKGRGLQLHDLREYFPGDELRDIDWKATARMNHPFVKTFEEERQLSIMFLVDVSASTRFGSNQLKSQMIAETAATLAFSALRNQDKVGLLLFSDQVELFLPPKKGLKHTLRIIRDLLYFQPKNRKTSLDNALSFLAKMRKKTGISFLFSDFLFEKEKHPSYLPFLKKEELIVFSVQDPLEQKIPVVPGFIRWEDQETGQTVWVKPKDPQFQQKFKENSAHLLNSHKTTFEKAGADFIELSTESPFAPRLKAFFAKRGAKKR